MTQEPGAGGDLKLIKRQSNNCKCSGNVLLKSRVEVGLKLKKNKAKSITAAVMQNTRAGWSWEF